MDGIDELIKLYGAEEPKRTLAPKENDKQFRDFFTQKGFKVNRTFGKAINKGSLHPYGLAADIDFNGKSDDEIGDLVEAALQKGYRVFDERVKQPGVKQTGPHLHFERNNGSKPSSFLQGRYGKRDLKYLTDLDNARLGKGTAPKRESLDDLLQRYDTVPTETLDDLLARYDAPAPEAPETIDAQIQSTLDPNNPKKGTLITPGEQIPTLGGLQVIDVPEGKLAVNPAKGQPKNLADAIGKVQDVGRDTRGTTLLTTDAQGNELSASIVRDSQAAQKQIELDRQMYPQAVNHELLHSDEVVRRRNEQLARSLPSSLLLPNAQPEAPEAINQGYQKFLKDSGLPDSDSAREAYNANIQFLSQDPTLQQAQGIVDYNKRVDDYTSRQQGIKASKPQGNAQPETIQVSKPRVVGKATDDMNTVAVEVTVPESVKTDEQAIRYALGQTDLTPRQIDQFIANRKRDGIKLLSAPLSKTRTIQVPYYAIAEAKGGDVGFENDPNTFLKKMAVDKDVITDIRSEQAQSRPSVSGVPNNDPFVLPEKDAEAELDKRIQDKGYSASARLSRAVSTPWLTLPNAILEMTPYAKDIDPKEEKQRLLNQYGSYGKAWQAEQYYQNADALEKTIRFANQTARSFTKNLFSGTGKTVALVSDLLEQNPVQQMIPEEYRPGIRNAMNLLDFGIRLATSRDAKTAYNEWERNTDATPLIKQHAFKALGEFDKAIGDDPVLKGRFLGSLADAGGSAAAFIALGAVMPSLPIGKYDFASALSGMVQSGGSGYEEGIQSGLSERDAKLYGVFQGLTGATEMFGAGNELAALIKNPSIRGKIAQGLLEVAKKARKEATEEFAQELFQTASGKSALEYLKDNDPSTFNKVWNALNRLPKQVADTASNEALIGLITGGVLGGGTATVEQGLSQQEEVEPTQAQPIQEEVPTTINETKAPTPQKPAPVDTKALAKDTPVESKAEPKSVESLLKYYEEAPTDLIPEAPLRPSTLEGAKNRIKEVETQLEEERRKGNTDKLTGLANQNAWEAAKERIEADPEQEVISIDVNRMKDVNDTTSHEGVNKTVLKPIGDAVQKVLEKHGIDARNGFRTGGDEFTVAVPKGKAQQVRDDIEKAFGVVNVTAEKDFTNTRTGESFKKGDVIPVTISGSFGNTVKEAEVELGKRKEESKGKNPVQRARTMKRPGGELVGESKKANLVNRDNNRDKVSQSTEWGDDVPYGGPVLTRPDGSWDAEAFAEKDKQIEQKVRDFRKKGGKTISQMRNASAIGLPITDARDPRVTGVVISQTNRDDVQVHWKSPLAIQTHGEFSWVNGRDMDELLVTGERQPITESRRKAKKASQKVTTKEEGGNIPSQDKQPWEMTADEVRSRTNKELANDSVTNIEDVENYTRQDLDQWRNSIEAAAMNRQRIPDNVLDSYVNEFGEAAFRQAFRGVAEQKGYLPQKVRDVEGYTPAIAGASDKPIYGRTWEEQKSVIRLSRTQTPQEWKDAKKAHRKAVEKALSEGKPVPAEVLADYPDLAPKKSAKQRMAEQADEATLKRQYDDLGDQLAKISRSLVFRDFMDREDHPYNDFLAQKVPDWFPPEIKEHNRLYKERDAIAAQLNEIADRKKAEKVTQESAKDTLQAESKPQTETNNDIEALPPSQRVTPEDLQDDVTFKTVEAKSRKQRANSKTGFTKAQTDYFVRKMQAAYQQLPVKNRAGLSNLESEFAKVSRKKLKPGSAEWNRRAKILEQIGLANTDIEAKGDATVTIKIPADGTFTFYSKQGIDRIHKKLTGKTVEDFLKAKQSPASLEIPKEAPKKETASKEQFQDYGEKIGGAKKDIYQRLEVTDSDLETQPLSKAFPRPDFAKLINEGSITKDAAKILSFIYDNIPPKPRKKYKVAGWVKQVNGVIDIYKQAFGEQPDAAEQLLEGLRKAQKQGLSKAADAFETYSAWLDVTGFPDKSLSMQGYALKKVQPWKKDASPEPEYLVVKGPFIKGVYKDAKAAAEALYKILTASPSGPKTSFSIYEDRKTKELFIGKKGAVGVVRLAEGFKTLKEAREFQQANQISLEEMWEAKKYKAGIERKDSGEETRVGKDWRKGKDIASTEEFAKTFGFKGVEFGNWVKQGSTKNERQQAINDAYDALMDLADILNIDPKALSLNGTLSLALGARGSGMASAHYESGKVVINLTKTRGKGSLGHEWWHALDNYFSRMRGDKSGYVTDSPRVGRIKDSGMFIDDPRVRKELLDAYRGVVDEIRASGMPKRSARMDATRSQAYWSTIVEMSARAFENYLITELGQQGRQSDHLANFRDMGEWAKLSLDPEAFPYPLDAEQGPINDAFRELFKTIKQRPTDEGNISLEMPAPAFFSQVERTIEQKMPNKASADQIKGLLKDAKKEELEWLDIDTFLKDNPNPTKQEVLDYVRANNAVVEEVTKEAVQTIAPKVVKQWGNAAEGFEGFLYKSELGEEAKILKYEDGRAVLTYDGGKKTFPSFDEAYEALKRTDRFNQKYLGDDTKFSQYTLPGGENYRELLLTMPDDSARGANYRVPSGHGYGDDKSDKNRLAHVRFDERDGGKTLHVAEIQSDWHQAGRKKGYKSEVQKKLDAYDQRILSGNKPLSAEERAEYNRLTEPANLGNEVPDAPFKTSWPLMAFKRVLRYAVENGYERVTFDTGETNAERYDLSKQVEEIRFQTKAGGMKEVRIELKNAPEKDMFVSVDAAGKVLDTSEEQFRGKNLDDVVGKEIAEKIMSEKTGKLRSNDLKVGGEGMKAFYDRILPSEINKYVKKWGGRVESQSIRGEQPEAIDVGAFGRWATKQGYSNNEIVADWNNGGPLTDQFIAEQTPNHPVHSLTITPAMRDAVMAGQTLFMPADSGSFKLQEDAQFAHPQDLLDRAKSSITDDGHIELNVEAGELLRRIAGKPNAFFGLTHTRGTLIQLSRKIDQKLDEFRKVGYSDAEIKVLTDLADQLREVAKKGAGVTYIFDFSLPHETHHQMVLNALNGETIPKETIDELSKLKVWNNPKIKTVTGQVTTFSRLYPRASGVTKAMEIAAMLDTGEITHADKNEFLKIFARGIKSVSTVNPDDFIRIFQYDSQTSDTGRSEAVGSEPETSRSTSEDRQTSPTKEEANQEAGTRPGDGQVQRPDSGTEVSVENKAVRQLTDYDRLFKKRKYAETLRENGYEDTPNVPYIPDTEKKWLADAQRRISASKHDDYKTAEKAFYEDNMEPQQRTALGIGLLDHLGSIGELERMIKVSEELVKHVGTAAQALRASQLAGKYDFVTGMMIATRAVKKAGKELTAKDAEKVRELLTRIAQTEEEKASLTYLNQELETAVKEADKNIKELEGALNEAQAERKVDEKTIARLKRQIATLKENRPRTYHAKQKAELERAKPDLEKILREAFSLAMNAPVTDAFKKWFGDSKVVDKDGKPLVVYHGTEADFDAFELSKSNFIKDALFLTDSPNDAFGFSTGWLPSVRGEGNPNILPVFVSLQNPLVYNNRGNVFSYILVNNLVEKARKGGHDGLIIKEMRNMPRLSGLEVEADAATTTYVVFEPSQIKSATGNKGTFDPNNPSILEMPADDRVHNALVDMASLDILNYVSPEDTIEHLRELTNNMLSEDELREIHLEAFEATKTESNITPEARKNSAIRMAHRRMAMQTAKPDVQKVRERPSRYDKEVITFGRNNGYTDKEILGAILFPKIKGAHSVNEWKKLVDGDDDTFKRSRELRQKVNNDIQDQIIKAKADREGYKGDLEKFKNEVIHNGIAGREARKAFDNYARKLGRSLGRKAFDFASETVSLFKGSSSWGEISYIGRQGFIPLLTDTRAAIKGDWKGVGHGLQGDNKLWQYLADKAGFENAAEYLSNHSLSVFVEQIRQHPRFLSAQNNGVRFTHIGDFNVADDHFSTQLLEKVPFYRRAEVAYTLPGDLQRLYIYDNWATMLEQQNLSADEMKKALKYVAETVNAFTGKGDIGRVIAKGGALSKALNLALFSPQLLFSRFQSLNKLTLGWATAPKGLKIQMAKKGLRFYGILAVIAALTGMVLDPEDEDFGKINIGDTHADLLAGLDVPAQLYMRTAMGFVKSVINQDTAYLADDIQANIREFGVSKEGQPRFVRSKLSPGASLAVDAYTGTDFIGRPFTWWGGLTSRSVPLAWQQTYDALLYDRYREMVKEPRTFEYAVNKFNENERNYLNALMVMAGTFTGIGVTQYPKADRSKAVQLAAQLSPFVSKKDAEQRRIEGGLRSLLADKFDLLKQNKDTRKVDAEIERWMKMNPNLNKKFSAINTQAGSKYGLLSLYLKDLNADQLRRVKSVATDPGEIEIIDKRIKTLEK